MLSRSTELKSMPLTYFTILTTTSRKFGEEESYHAGEFGGAVQVGEQEIGNFDALASAAAVKLKKNPCIYCCCEAEDNL